MDTTPLSDVPEIVARLREGFVRGRTRDLADRRRHLETLRAALVDEEEALVRALHADLGKSRVEAWVTDVGFVVREIDHALDHLEAWAAPRPASVPLSLRPASARVVPEPLGVATVIAPWNYPLHLVLAPAVAALAAGNTVVLKPSELAPAVASSVADLVARHLPDDVVDVVLGGVPQATALLGERVDHVFFTGGEKVGRVVMRAAAEHLTPVTLELGGKSPAIVTADADVDLAARRIVLGKLLNAGQSCVAPDHVLVDRRVEDRLLDAIADAITSFLEPDPSTSRDYGRIINEHHHDRLTGLLDAGGFDRVVVGGHADRETLHLDPTVLAGVHPDAAVMDEEIFGPILPVVAVDDARAAVAHVNARPRPLALYVFTRSSRQARAVIDQTSSGGAVVNHTMVHLVARDLPFGGVGRSGMGAYHGQAGFDTFSHLRSVLTASARVDPPTLYPPYSTVDEWLLRRLL